MQSLAGPLFERVESPGMNQTIESVGPPAGNHVPPLSTPSIDPGTFFKVSPNAYMVVDRDLRLVEANEAYLQSVGGVRREDILGRLLFEAFPGNPEDPNDIGVRQVRASLVRVLSTKKADHLAAIPYWIEIDGAQGLQREERFWSATHTPVLDADGQVAFILQHTVDITDLYETRRALRAAEAALVDTVPFEQKEQGVIRRARLIQEANQTLESERRYLRLLFDQAPGFIAILNGPDHVFDMVNDAYYQIVGHRDIIGKAVREALPELEGQGFYNLLDRVYLTGEPYVGRGIRVLVERTPGAELAEVYVDFLYQPIVDTDGTVTGIFAQGHEMSEMVAAQRALEQLNNTLEHRVQQRTRALRERNRELQDFANFASHDLQEPLRKIHSFGDLLMAEYGPQLDETALSYVRRMQNAAARMSALITDLLTYSRIQTRREPFVPVSIDATIREVLVDLEQALIESEAEIITENLPEIEADATQMRQLFQNLIGNAVKYRKPTATPRIEIRGRAVRLNADGASEAVISVTDNGIGFDEKYLDRIFAPFQRLQSGRAYAGTGMGLSICRRIIERHNGSIGAKSVAGEGSTFTVRLPFQQPEYVG
jgi:signal transduction histidine kinase